MKQNMIQRAFRQWRQLDHMHMICTSLQVTMPAPHHSIFLRPTSSVKALKAKNSLGEFEKFMEI